MVVVAVADDEEEWLVVIKVKVKKDGKDSKQSKTGKTYMRILLARESSRASVEQRCACEPCTGQEKAAAPDWEEELVRIRAPWTHCPGLLLFG